MAHRVLFVLALVLGTIHWLGPPVDRAYCQVVEQGYSLTQSSEQDSADPAHDEETNDGQAEAKSPPEQKTHSLGEVVVTAPGSAEVMKSTPESTIFDLENYEKPAPIRSVVDVFKDSALVDFLAKSPIDDLDLRGESPVLLRGFDTYRFVNAIDGVTFDQPLSFGQVVDYSQVPLGQVSEIEIIPGSHSARYWGKSIGGVINIKTKEPKIRENCKPDLTLENDYGYYETIDSKGVLEGGYKSFNYVFSAQRSFTDGYLRHGEAEVENYAWSLGYVLPAGGFIKYTGTYAQSDYDSYAINDPARPDYDPDYPIVKPDTGASDIKIDSRTHFETLAQRFSYVQPTPIGKLQAGLAYVSRPEHYFTQISNGQYIRNPNSPGEQLAILVQDEIELFAGNTLALGFDSQDFWVDFEPHGARNHLRNNKSCFLEDTWQITPRLRLRGGLRYENVQLSINNYSEVAGWGSVQGYQVTLDPPQKYLERDYDQLLPKFFMTYGLDDICTPLRDTSVSLGISRVWNVAPYCLTCPGRMAQVDPEHGVNFDLILNRRLWRDINLKIDYSYYKINDYVVNNWNYAKYYLGSGMRNPNLPAGLEGSDMYINLDEVDRHGVEVEVSGSLPGNFSFYAGYAFQDLQYDGPEPAGKALGDVAQHRVNAGLRWHPFPKTTVMLDYKFQDKQIAHVITEQPAGSGNYVSRDNPMDAFHLFDFGVEQSLFSNKIFKDVVVGLYVNNLFDEDYEESRGYPMPGRSITGSIRLRF